MRNLITGFSIDKTGESAITEKRLKDQVKAMVAAMEPQIEKMTSMTLYSIYKDVPAKEYDEYLSFYSTDYGKWFTETTSSAMYKGLNQIFEKSIKRIAKTIKIDKKAE